MYSPFLRLEINDKLVGESGLANRGTRCILRRGDFAGDGPREVLAIEDAESIAFQCPRRRANGDVHAIVAAARAQRVVRIILLETKTTSYYREYRLRQPIVDGTSTPGLISLAADPVMLDLASRGPLRTVTNGRSNFVFELAEQTVEEIAQFIVDSANAAGLNWLTLGDVDPDFEFPSFRIERLTHLAAADQLHAAVRERDISCEHGLVRTGDTGYALSFVSAFGSGITTRPFLTKSGQLALTRTFDAPRQVTRAWYKGGMDPDGEPGTGGRARWIVANPNAGANTFEVEDRVGGAPPIAFDDQVATWYVYRVKTGETLAIANTTAGPPSVVEVAAPGIGSLVAGEEIEFRVDEPATSDRYIRWGDSGNRLLERAVFRIDAIDGGTNELTLSQPWDDIDPIAANGAFDGCRAELHTRIIEAETATAIPASNTYDFATLNLPGAVQVGDWLIPATNSTVPYDAGIDDDAIAVIDSIDGGADTVTVSPKWREGADPVTSSSLYSGVRIYRFLRNDRVLASTASTNKIKVASVAGVSVGDVVVLTKPFGAGEIPPYSEHPVHVQAPPTGYGVQSGDVDKPLLLGVEQLAPNGFQRAWSGSLADGFTKAGSGTVTKNTDPAFTKIGPHSALITDWRSGSGVTNYNYAPVYPSLGPGNNRVSARVWLYFTEFTDTAGDDLQLKLELYELDQAGAVLGAALASASFFAPDHPTAPPEQRARVGGWVSLAIAGLEVLPFQGPHGLLARITGDGTIVAADNPVAYVGGIEVFGHTQCPEEPYELGDARQLVQTANRTLREFALPERFDATLLNGGVDDPGRALDRALGGTVPLINVDYAVNAQHRLVRAEFAHFKPEQTRCAFTQRHELLTDPTA